MYDFSGRKICSWKNAHCWIANIEKIVQISLQSIFGSSSSCSSFTLGVESIRSSKNECKNYLKLFLFKNFLKTFFRQEFSKNISVGLFRCFMKLEMLAQAEFELKKLNMMAELQPDFLIDPQLMAKFKTWLYCEKGTKIFGVEKSLVRFWLGSQFSWNFFLIGRRIWRSFKVC